MRSILAQVKEIFDVAKQGPEPIDRLVAKASIVYGESYSTDMRAIARELSREGEGGPLRLTLGQHFARWDAEQAPSWADGSTPNTPERRQAIYARLKVANPDREVLDDKLPVFVVRPPIVIGSEDWTPWYDEERRRERSFYWDAVTAHLRTHLHWQEAAIISLEQATTAIVERLADPLSLAPRRTKGLVVGYVQSGKTANITGVLARAADAGYRLIIVLAGTLNILRDQTQRRIDRDLVGVELLEDEYVGDFEFPGGFLSHGQRPSTLGAFDWVRLTGRTEEYRGLRAGSVEALRFALAAGSQRFNDPATLHPSAVRLFVVKKNAAVLGKLARDLQRVDKDHSLADVPVLVIDDESDQASVNTMRPVDDGSAVDRTRVNDAITGLLRALPRAQYVGYTATPFANVFVNPDDAADLFPSDFIIALPRPTGYLGASDFHDLDGRQFEATQPFRSNERAFVRPLDDGDVAGLQTAIDSFILSGAIKRYRMGRDRSLGFRHHTMMIHTSHRVSDHNEQSAAAREALRTGGYRTGAAAARLQELFERDFAPVSRARAAHLPVPDAFDELVPFIEETLGKLYFGEDPVLVVNSSLDATKVAFDGNDEIWKIIVGGAKLSRGFTVEGLTVSYFRRRSKAADTLMQMGRWCGFRRGYDDLIRLYIGGEDDGPYRAFEAICRDEEAFREQLERYALRPEGTPPITPKQVPPLVLSHAEWIKPTSRNKMFNAVITSKNFGDSWAEHRRVTESEADKRHNLHLFERLISGGLQAHETTIGGSQSTYLWTAATQDDVRSFLASYRFADRRPDFQLELEFLDGQHGDPAIDDWVILLPQLTEKRRASYHQIGGERLSLHMRAFWTKDPPLMNALVGPDDRAVAEAITGKRPAAQPDVSALRRAKRAVLVAYPVKHSPAVPEDFCPTIGIALLFPRNSIERQIAFSVRRREQAESVVVDL